jgi:hypothetical protein
MRRDPFAGRHRVTRPARDLTGLRRWARITALAVPLSFLGAFFVGTIAPLAAHGVTL